MTSPASPQDPALEGRNKSRCVYPDIRQRRLCTRTSGSRKDGLSACDGRLSNSSDGEVLLCFHILDVYTLRIGSGVELFGDGNHLERNKTITFALPAITQGREQEPHSLSLLYPFSPTGQQCTLLITSQGTIFFRSLPVLVGATSSSPSSPSSSLARGSGLSSAGFWCS